MIPLNKWVQNQEAMNQYKWINVSNEREIIWSTKWQGSTTQNWKNQDDIHSNTVYPQFQLPNTSLQSLYFVSQCKEHKTGQHIIWHFYCHSNHVDSSDSTGRGSMLLYHQNPASLNWGCCCTWYNNASLNGIFEIEKDIENFIQEDFGIVQFSSKPLGCQVTSKRCRFCPKH